MEPNSTVASITNQRTSTTSISLSSSGVIGGVVGGIVVAALVTAVVVVVVLVVAHKRKKNNGLTRGYTCREGPRRKWCKGIEGKCVVAIGAF